LRHLQAQKYDKTVRDQQKHDRKDKEEGRPVRQRLPKEFLQGGGMLLVCGLNKAAERNMIGRRLRRAESGWAQFQVPPDAVAFAPRRNETRSLSLMPALRVKSGTAGFA
jgi:hypothetical protein